MKSYFLSLAAALVACAAVFGACEAGNGSQLSNNSSNQGGDPNSGGSGGSNFTVGSGGNCGGLCSADLKSVLGCEGQVIETCGGDQACLNGACSDDPCGAADAAKSSYGCDYWAVKPDLIGEGAGACFAAYVANTWDIPIHISVARGGVDLGTAFIYIPQGQGQAITLNPYNAAAGLDVGQVALVFLSHQSPQPAAVPSCPLPAAMNAESGVLGTGRGQAFNIKTDRPVVAYSILPYGGGPSAATSATLLLPTSAWDTNYIAVNAYPKSQVVIQAQPSLNILAYQDATDVTILPKVPIVGGTGVTAGAANTPTTYTLAAGEYLQLSQDAELTGSPIQSTKPIGVWGAASCLNVPVAESACDSAHQQIPPIKALGSTYAGVRHRNRLAKMTEEAPPWRMVGAVDGTVLTWTPSAPPGAPAALNLGDVVEFAAPGPFVVSSQDEDHPFYVAQYMTGAGFTFPGEGDPEWVNIIPVAQYLDDYVFFTDPTYPETSLVVVRRKSTVDGMFKDVTLDCAGALGGWQPLGELEYTRVDLVTGDYQSVNGCTNGLQHMSSQAAFGVTVWGWGGYSPSFYAEYVSYAYPAGASIQPINEVVVPPTPR